MIFMGKVQAHKRAEKAKRQEDFREKNYETDNSVFEIEGAVTDCLPNTSFRLNVTKCEPYPQMVGKQLLGTLAGKMRLFRIRVLPGDEIKAYVSKYDLTKCKITYRSTKQVSQ
jgi:translation initiation factor IF-1